MRMVMDYWEGYRNKRVSLDQTSFDPTKKYASAMNVTGKRGKCRFCDKYRKKFAASHTTERCYFGDKEGYTKISNLVEENKEISNYSLFSYSSDGSLTRTFHDSGCTPISYFKDKPSNLISKIGFVRTASNEVVKTLGIGDVKIGN